MERLCQRYGWTPCEYMEQPQQTLDDFSLIAHLEAEQQRMKQETQ